MFPLGSLPAGTLPVLAPAVGSLGAMWEILAVVVVVLVLAGVQIRRRTSKLQRAEDPRAHLGERGRTPEG